MRILLVHHLPDCAPLSPCISCQVASFLKSRLSEKEMEELIEMFKTEALKTAIALEALVEELMVPRKVLNCLNAQGLYKIGDLLRVPENELRQIWGMGRLSMSQLREALEKRGRRVGELFSPEPQT